MTEGRRRSRSASDEHYLIDICDQILGRLALRQHRFDFLRGDPGRRALGAKLPVDAWYPDLHLVVEVLERQHDTPTPFFDRRPTLSGVSRGEQRRIYDARRAEVLPRHGIRLVCLSVASFAIRRGKLVRQPVADRAIVEHALALPREPIEKSQLAYAPLCDAYIDYSAARSTRTRPRPRRIR